MPVIKRTKIVCTLGPSSESVSTITKMVHAGMNVARLNFSHGTHANHKKLIKAVRTVAKNTGEPLAIMQDLQGPKIRVGVLPEKGIEFVAGKEVVFDTHVTTYHAGIIPIDFKELHAFIKPGERLLLNDGRVETIVTQVQGTKITAEVKNEGIITSHKGINVPDTKLGIRSLTEKDKKDVKFGVMNGVDLIALSFVTSANDVIDLRYLIQEYEKELEIIDQPPIKIIAKIERAEAVKDIDKILDVVDGIMIARGDLGIEMPAQDVPLIQKRLIDKALAYARPVIVATQMLDSMQHAPRPTRAEVSDVANAVIDHTDAVMLSNESAVGEYVEETVQMMASIIIETESSEYVSLSRVPHLTQKTAVDNVISSLSKLLAEQTKAKVILAASLSGETARLISRNRPGLPIVVATSSTRVMHQLAVSHGVIPFIIPQCRSIEELLERSMVYLKERKLVVSGDMVVIVAGEPVGQAGHVNLLELKEVQ